MTSVTSYSKTQVDSLLSTVSDAADAAQAAADAALVAPRTTSALWIETTDKQAAAVNPAVVAIGDSFTAESYITTAWDGSAGSRRGRYAADSYLTAAMVYGRWPCTLIPAGVSGQAASGGLARFDTDVTARRPQIVIEEFGSNDMATNRTAAATFADRSAMWAKARAFGAKVIATTCPPRNTFTTAQMKEALKLNTMLRNYASTNPQDFALVDMWTVLADPATGQYRSGYSNDGTHPNTLGSWVVGKAFKPALDRFLAGTAPLAVSNINDDNLLANPLMVNTGGSIASNNGLTGSAPGSWSAKSGGTDANTTAVLSLVARADGMGNWAQISTTTIPAGIVVQLTQIVTSGFAAGDVAQVCIEFETDSAGWTNGALNVEVWGYSSDFSMAYSYNDAFYAGADTNINVRPESGVLKTPPFVIPTGTVNLYLLVSVGGTGTVRFGRPAIRKLATS